jgi:methionine aminopeptidase|tara:strand:- start:432 stop:770 length:339 start_codon:yes stop_codon:yes gene_type:complete
LEIWNIDDRIIKDKDHRKRPQAEKTILKKKEKFNKPQSFLSIMKILQNKYQDYTQLIQFDRMIMFYQGRKYFNMFNVEDRELSRIPVKVSDGGKIPVAFSTAIHYKEQNKIG